MDRRLRELCAGISPGSAPDLEHLAILMRWQGSSWRDGEWIGFDSFEKIPYRKIVNAVARVAARSSRRYTEAIVLAALQSWLRSKSLWPPRLRQQVTRTGLAYTATLLVVALIAFVSANNLMFLILAAMLATFMISGFISKLSLAGLELELFLPQHISARRKVRARRPPQEYETLDSFLQHSPGRRGGKRIRHDPLLPRSYREAPR